MDSGVDIPSASDGNSRANTATPSLKRPRVVIIGAGFAGLAAAKGLAKAPCDITLIDRRNYHLFQPLLYQVATAALSPADIASPIRSILRRQKNARVIMGRVVDIDVDGRLVTLENGVAEPYDYLIVATGARHAYFNHDEWESVAPGLKKIDDATDIRRRILTAFELAEVERDEHARQALLTFVVVGGGPTGQGRVVCGAGSWGFVVGHQPGAHRHSSRRISSHRQSKPEGG